MLFRSRKRKEPPKLKENIKSADGPCPKNPLWTSRYEPIGGKENRWWPVRFDLTSEQRALNQAGKWTNYHNRYAISPVPPESEPGTDGSGMTHKISWRVVIPENVSGWYKLTAQADEKAKIYIDDYISGNNNSAIFKRNDDPIISGKPVLDIGLHKTKYIGHEYHKGGSREQSSSIGNVLFFVDYDKLKKTKDKNGKKSKAIKITAELENSIRHTIEKQTREIFNTDDWIVDKNVDVPIPTPPEVKLPPLRKDFGDSGEIFGHRDYSEAIKIGYTPAQLLDHMRTIRSQVNPKLYQEVLINGRPRNPDPDSHPVQAYQVSEGGYWAGNFNTYNPFVKPYELVKVSDGEIVDVSVTNVVTTRTEAKAYFVKEGGGFKIIVTGNEDVEVTFRVEWDDSAGEVAKTFSKFEIKDLQNIEEALIVERKVIKKGNNAGSFRKKYQTDIKSTFKINGEGMKKIDIEIEGNDGRCRIKTGIFGEKCQLAFTGDRNGKTEYTAWIDIVEVENLKDSYSFYEKKTDAEISNLIGVVVGNQDELDDANELTNVEVQNGEVKYTGPAIVSYFNSIPDEKGNIRRYATPYLPGGTTETFRKFNSKGEWLMKWESVNFPKDGIYDVEIEGDDSAMLYIDGHFMDKVVSGDKRKTLTINVSEGHHNIEVRLNSNTNSLIALTLNRVYVRVKISIEEEVISRDNKLNPTPPSWMDNPLGISMAIIPPPCREPKDGGGVVDGVDIIEPGNYPFEPANTEAGPYDYGDDGYNVSLEIDHFIIRNHGINYYVPQDGPEQTIETTEPNIPNYEFESNPDDPPPTAEIKFKVPQPEVPGPDPNDPEDSDYEFESDIPDDAEQKGDEFKPEKGKPPKMVGDPIPNGDEYDGDSGKPKITIPDPSSGSPGDDFDSDNDYDSPNTPTIGDPYSNDQDYIPPGSGDPYDPGTPGSGDPYDSGAPRSGDPYDPGDFPSDYDGDGDPYNPGDPGDIKGPEYGDRIVVNPPNGFKGKLVPGPYGSIVDIIVEKPGSGWTEYPEVYINTRTGINADIVPIFKINRDPLDIPEDQLIQVTDLVGLKQTGFVNGRPYFGDVYYSEGLLYAGKYFTGTSIPVYSTLRESITGQRTTRPSAILRQGTDVSSNDPTLNVPGTPQTTQNQEDLI